LYAVGSWAALATQFLSLLPLVGAQTMCVQSTAVQLASVLSTLPAVALIEPQPSSPTQQIATGLMRSVAHTTCVIGIAVADLG
jgi:hypothetical protein